jgi:hypothetical protein
MALRLVGEDNCPRKVVVAASSLQKDEVPTKRVVTIREVTPRSIKTEPSLDVHAKAARSSNKSNQCVGMVSKVATVALA